MYYLSVYNDSFVTARHFSCVGSLIFVFVLASFIRRGICGVLVWTEYTWENVVL